MVVRQSWSLAVWYLLGLGVGFGLWPRERISPLVIVVLATLACFGAWTAASLAWTTSPERTLAEIARIGTHLAILVALAFLVSRAAWPRVLTAILLAAATICLLAIAGRLAPSWFDAAGVAQPGNARRLTYPLGYWNALGIWAAMTAVLALACSAHYTARWARGLSLALVPVAATVGYLTYSRATAVAAGVGLAVITLGSRNRWTLTINTLVATGITAGVVSAIRDAPEIANATGSSGGLQVLLALGAGGLACFGAAAIAPAQTDRIRLPRRTTFAVWVSVIAVAAAVSLAVGPSLVSEGWDQFKSERVTEASDPAARLTNLNSGSRYLQWQAALDTFKDAPLKGVGAGTFEFEQNIRNRSGEFVRDAHSLYVETLAELGVIGALLLATFIGAVAVLLVAALRTTTSPADQGLVAGASGAVAAYFTGAGVDWMWESTANTTLMLALVGSVGAGLAVPRTRRLAWGPRGGLVAAMLLMSAIQLPGLVATSEIRKSREAVARGALPSAREHANSAIDAAPWAGSPLVQRALVDERAGALDSARVELRAAREREPRDWRIPLILARVEARRGDVDAALAAFEAARQLRPRGQFFRPPS